MKKNNKKSRVLFVQKVNELIKSKNPLVLEEGRYKLNTTVGELMVIIHDELDQDLIYSIFTRFDEPKRARETVKCNPFSGKYNFHFTEIDDCLSSFSQFLDDVVIV